MKRNISFVLNGILIMFFLSHIVQGIGIGSSGMGTHFFVYKGQKGILVQYGITNVSDDNGDGVPQAYSYINELTTTDLFRQWISFRPTHQVLNQLIPPQNTGTHYGQTLYYDASNLIVGNTYNFQSGVCSECPPGQICARACVQIGLKYLHIIPYPITIHHNNSPNGSFSRFNLTWGKPNPLYWNLDHYAIFYRDDDSVRIGELSNAIKVLTDIGINDTTIEIIDGRRGVNSFYAIVGYDSLGEAIAISESFQIDYSHTTFSLLTPQDGTVMGTLTPTLDWADYGGATSYTLWYSEDSTFSAKTEVAGIVSSDYTFISPLGDHKTYYWKVKTNEDIFCDETGWCFSTNIINFIPSAFDLLLPANSSIITTKRPSFSWQNSIDNGDVIEYVLVIAKDVGFTDVVLTDTTINNYYNIIDDLEDDVTHYWKVKAEDTNSQNIWSSSVFLFTVNYDDYPSNFSLIFPRWNYGQHNVNELPVETNLTPMFQWAQATDSDLGSSITYKLWYSTDSTFVVKTEVVGIIDTFYQPTEPLTEDQYYYWRVFAVDNSNHITPAYGLPFAFVTNTFNENISIPNLIQPIDGDTLIPIEVYFTFEAIDPDKYDVVFYNLKIATDSSFENIIYTIENSLACCNASFDFLEGGKYYWQITTNSVRIDGTSGGSAASPIHSFYVPTPTLRVVSPNGGEVFRIGNTYRLAWEGNIHETVKLSGVPGGNFTNMESTGEAYPTIPEDYPLGTDYKVFVQANYFDLKDSSDNSFSVIAPVIVSPAKDELLIPESFHDIIWDWTEISGNVKIEFTTDNGNNWIIIAYSTPCDGQYNWQVPNMPSNACKIKITSLEDLNFYYVSLWFFTITLPQGLVAYYPFNASANDESGNDINGILHNVSSVEDRFGNQGKAFFFSGDNNFVSVDRTFKLSLQNQASLALWLKGAEAPNVFARIKGLVDDGIEVGTNTDSTIRAKWTGNGIWYDISTNKKINDNLWHLVTFVITGNTGTLYVDSDSVGGTTASDSLSMTNSCELVIGGSSKETSIDYYHGSLDDIRIYNYSLSYSEILNLFYKEYEGNYSEIKLLADGLYNPSLNKMIVTDTVHAYLRIITYPYTILDSAKAIIDSMNFIGRFYFLNAPSGEYYVVIKQRNGIETWSKEGGQSFTEGMLFNYDFTTSSEQAYSNNMIQRGSRWCIYSGEIANSDEYIDGDDVTAAFNAQGLAGYVIQDVTGDNYVDGDDVTVVFNNQGIGAIRPPFFGATCEGTVNYEGKTYNIENIGGQCWLKENLDVGNIIQGGQNANNNGIIEKYCYNNDPNNCNVFGGLYQWAEAMQYTGAAGSRGICPPGWHIPTEADWQKLNNYVNNSGNALKEIGQGIGSGVGTNTSGFSALLAGLFDHYQGFFQLGVTATLWSSSLDNSHAKLQYLDNNTDAAIIYSTGTLSGLSVRCLKD